MKNINPINISTNFKENICEMSTIGVPIKSGEYKLIIEELCENNFYGYFYEISTYTMESFDGFKTVTNLIELHQNKNENYDKNNEFKVDNEEFYNGVQYMEKIEDFLSISRFYIKYIANAFVNFTLGNANVVEMARCEENMNFILLSLGYKEIRRVKKRGEFIKFKNLPVIVLIFQAERLDHEPNQNINSQIPILNNNQQQQKKKEYNK